MIRVMVRVTQALIRSRVKYRMSGSQLLRAVSYQDFDDEERRREKNRGLRTGEQKRYCINDRQCLGLWCEIRKA